MRRIVLVQRLFVGAAIWLVGLAGQGGAQDHTEYEAADIEYGLAVYRSQCVTCHGESGAEIAGVDLRSGQIRRAGSDRELRALISNGIPGTGMLSSV